MKAFGAEPNQASGRADGALVPKVIVGIALDIQPIPVQVPKRSISADYRRDAVGMK